jgi:hypothetical protein
LPGFWVAKPVIYEPERAKGEELKKRIGNMLPAGKPKTKAAIDTALNAMPKRIAVNFFFPLFYRGKAIDASLMVARLMAVVNFGTFVGLKNLEIIAEYPALKQIADGALELDRQRVRELEQIGAKVQRLETDKRGLEERLAESQKVTRLPAATPATPTLLRGTGGYGESGQETPTGKRSPLNLGRLKVIIPILVILSGIGLLAYGLTIQIPANASAVQQAAASQAAAAYSAIGVLLTLGSGLGWLFLRRRAKPRPEDFAQNPPNEAAAK